MLTKVIQILDSERDSNLIENQRVISENQGELKKLKEELKRETLAKDLL